MSRHRALNLELLERREYLAADLIITELMASNDTTLVDEDGNSPDWIEVHNPTDQPINLLGWSLSDDPTTPGKWRFPYQEIAPNEYLVVFASGKDRAYDVEALRQDFHTTPDGTFLIDLAAGTYDVRLTLGDSQRTRDNVAIHVQGQVVDTVSTFAGQFVQPTYEATVDSGSGNQLAIRLEDLGGETGRAALAGLIVTPRDGGEPLRFDFGIDNSPLAEGFQRITSDDSYAPTVGHGWADGVVLSAVDRGADTLGLHTNFKLSAGGENVALVDPDGQIHSQFGPDGADYPEQFPDIAYGLASVQFPFDLEATSVAYLIPSPEDAALGTRWTGLEFDDTAWSRGAGATAGLSSSAESAGISSGIGFGDDLSPATDVRTEMLGVNASLYLRQEFQVDDPADAAGLVLQMQYDDGFVAYLNGVKVADSKAPDVLSWNAEATRPNYVADSWEGFDISPYTGALVAGTNVLAVHGLNQNPADPDMFIGAKLVALAPVNADTTITGYLQEPTPGRFNTPIRSVSVTFDQESGFFTEPLTLQLSADASDATIYFTTDGTLPTETSAVYDSSQPIEIATTTLVQAMSVAPGGAASTTTSVWFVTTSPGLNAFDSNLPIVVLENFGAGRTGSITKQLNAFAIFEPDEQTGRSTIDGSPDLVSRAGLKRRGSSTAKRDKASYALEAWDEKGKQRDIAPLGLPSDSDWILYAPLDFDRALIRNPLIYELSNQVGRYAVRTRFVEVYQNLDGGDLAVEDYRGVYVLMEKIKRGPDRVDITGLEPEDGTEPAVSGGWMLKIDRKDPSDRGGFSAASQRIRYVDPKEADVTPRQIAWIKDYFNRMYTSLTDTDPETGYAQFIDVDSWIDHHILNVLALNVDALRLSTYFFKDRGGKLEFGPVWDFDRSMESNDPRDDRPDAWGNASFFGDPWWKELFQDPVFEQRWWDRWYELRQGVLSNDNINAVIDSMASQLAEVQRRNFDRWPASRPRTSALTNYKSGELDGSWQGEIDHMRNWLMARLAWIDSQSIGPPAIEPAPGRLAVGEEIGFLADTDVVYYTLDGSDPRSADGQIDPAAVVYNDIVDFFSVDDPLRYRIPTGGAGEADWQAADFDDSEWNSATGGLGFDTGIDDPSVRLPSGFTVRQVVSSGVVANLNTADAVLAGNDAIGETTETGVPTINYLSPRFQPTEGQARQDHFDADRELPNGGGNNFVLHATATLVLDVGGIYTFGINNDDGARLRIDGETVILDDTLLETKVDHLGAIFLPAGTHTIDLVMFQLARNDGVELFYARGEYLDFNERFLLLGASDDQPFAPSIGTDIEADMRGASGSVYARYPFLVSSPENVQRLTLQLQYDDGFVAYLNGTEVARRNAPSTVDFASTATVAHPDRESLRAESIDLTPLRHLLQSGANVLAIQGLNADVSNPDFLLAPSLRGSIVRERLVFDAPMEIRARLRIGETWSALTDARFQVAGAADDARQLAITEINYNPQPPSETEQSENAAWRSDDFEFIELKNLGDHTIDLAGVGISQGITFTFPESGAPQLAPGAIAVVVRDRSAFEARYGTGLPVVGQFERGRLNNDGERIVLSDRFGTTIVDLQYDDGFGWPRRADGAGSTLEVIDPTGDPNGGVNWRASQGYGGSPGRRGAATRSGILINEVLARSGTDEEDRVELFNTSSRTIDVSGWYLSSDANNLAAHALPAGTTLDAGQYVVLSSSQTGLTLDGSQGGDLWLMEGGPHGVPTRFADHVTFQATPVGESVGRWPSGDADARLFPMTGNTFGEANSGPRAGAVVLSEVHFAPQPLAIAGIDFSDDQAGDFQAASGDWRVEGGRYHATPDANGDAVALLPQIGALLNKTSLAATITVPAVTDFNKNALLVFDYQGPADFKFVSIHTTRGRFRIGQRIDGRWEFLDQVDQSVASDVPIPVSVVLDGTVARLSVFNFERVSYDFGEPLNDGLIGLATKNGEAFFDDVVVETPRDAKDFEFVELVNTTNSAIDLNGWQLSGGIDFTFTENRPVDAGGVVVVVSFNPRSDTNLASDFRQRMGIDSSVQLAGPFLGHLSDTSDVIELSGPVDAAPADGEGLMLVDRVVYKTESPWPSLATAQGQSLHRVAADQYGDLSSSWWVSGATAGSAQFARPGDLDRNGVVDGHDIGAFALTLIDPSAYEQTYGVPARLGGDFDADGDVDYDDIAGLVGLIQQQTSDSQAARAVDAVMNDLDGP